MPKDLRSRNQHLVPPDDQAQRDAAENAAGGPITVLEAEQIARNPYGAPRVLRYAYGTSYGGGVTTCFNANPYASTGSELMVPPNPRIFFVNGGHLSLEPTQGAAAGFPHAQTYTGTLQSVQGNASTTEQVYWDPLTVPIPIDGSGAVGGATDIDPTFVDVTQAAAHHSNTTNPEDDQLRLIGPTGGSSQTLWPPDIENPTMLESMNGGEMVDPTLLVDPTGFLSGFSSSPQPTYDPLVMWNTSQFGFPSPGGIPQAQFPAIDGSLHNSETRGAEQRLPRVSGPKRAAHGLAGLGIIPQHVDPPFPHTMTVAAPNTSTQILASGPSNGSVHGEMAAGTSASRKMGVTSSLLRLTRSGRVAAPRTAPQDFEGNRAVLAARLLAEGADPILVHIACDMIFHDGVTLEALTRELSRDECLQHGKRTMMEYEKLLKAETRDNLTSHSCGLCPSGRSQYKHARDALRHLRHSHFGLAI